MAASKSTIGRLGRILFSLKGRLPRRQFWLGIVVVFVGGAFTSQNRDTLAAVAGLLTMYVALAIYGKRLHDFDRTAWYMAVPICLSFAFWLYAFSVVRNAALGAFQDPRAAFHEFEAITRRLQSGWLAVGAAWAAVTVVLGSVPGNKGDNRFGMSPDEARDLPIAPPAEGTA